MSVGKGSLKRAASANAKAEDKDRAVKTNTIAEVEVLSISHKKVKDVSKMAASVARYGVLVPVVLAKDENGLTVIDGNKRLCALEKLGVKSVVAVIIEGNAKEAGAELDSFKVAPATKKVADIHEEKFNVIKRLDEDVLPIYLL